MPLSSEAYCSSCESWSPAKDGGDGGRVIVGVEERSVAERSVILTWDHRLLENLPSTV